MLRARRLVSAFAIAVAAAVPAAAQTIDVGGQVRPRYESRGGGSTESDAHASLRTRLHLLAELAPKVHTFVELQDVRVMGEEMNTLTDFRADDLDIHQAYIDLGRAADRFELRVGRQEAAYGGERLVGAVNWAQQARSFDGMRARVRGGPAVLDAFAFQIADATASNRDADERFVGLYSVVTLAPDRTLDAYALHDREDAAAATAQTTLGLRHVGRTGSLRYRFEGAYQLGERDGRDVRAHLLGARVGTDVLGGRAHLQLWYDHLSGDPRPAAGRTRVFETLFATNHKFYGHADLFLDIPTHTAGRGLRDIALKGDYRFTDRLAIGLDAHHFRLAEPAGFAARLGEELDLTARYRYTENFTATGGAAYVIGGPGLADLGRLDGNLVFGYLMLDATF